LLGAIAYVAYRKARRRNRVSRESSPETDAAMMLLGSILLFWPIALSWLIHEYSNAENKRKYWMMFNINGFLLMSLIPLGWEVYFLYGFVAVVVALFMCVWAAPEGTEISNNSDSY
jgi:hypothetical protein